MFIDGKSKRKKIKRENPIFVMWENAAGVCEYFAHQWVYSGVGVGGYAKQAPISHPRYVIIDSYWLTVS